MSIEFLPPEVDELTPRIAVIGVGGAGGNAIANMMRAEVQGVDFLVANTDSQALKQSSAPHRIQLGAKITQGLGAGSRPEIGRAAAEETIDQLIKTLEGAHMCFIAAGMGGGTGTGAAPVIAKAARDMGILTVGVVTKPFAFEGNRRAKSAEAGIEELQKYVDTLIVIPNQNLFLVANANTTFKEAFQMADEVLQQGDNRAIEAASKAIANPLLDGVSMKGAKGVIVSITGGDDMRLLEVDEAANHIRELVDEDANIIWGSAFNPDLEGRIRVSVVATGIEASARPVEAAAPASRAFTFTAPKKAEEPVAAEPVVAETPVEEPVADSLASDTDELVLGSETEVVDLDNPVEMPPVQVFGDEPAIDAAPAKDVGVATDGGARRRWLSPGTPPAEEAAADEPAPPPPAPRVKLGGTLFERMSGASRGAAREEEPTDKDPLDIPRFLHRQNNQ
ncbi:MAG: cell division protein FtsZ [Pseudomonadota bacterium]